MISRAEILMGRDKEYPLSAALEKNLSRLLYCLNLFRMEYGWPMYVSSGYRPGHYNRDAGGANGSAHLSCEAVDFRDNDRALARFCEAHEDILETCGLYLEQPAFTPTWVHLQTRPPRSGSRIFIP